MSLYNFVATVAAITFVVIVGLVVMLEIPRAENPYVVCERHGGKYLVREGVCLRLDAIVELP